MEKLRVRDRLILGKQNELIGAKQHSWARGRRRRNSRQVGNPSLIWCDPVNIFESLGWFLHVSFRGQDQQQPRQVMATIDQADIRGSEPHNHDPSGAASD